MKRKTVDLSEMEEVSLPLFQTRDFCSYWQCIEIFIDDDDKERYIWQFYICGFTDDDQCHILKWDKTKELIPIDKGGRIFINGKFYNRTFWNH